MTDETPVDDPETLREAARAVVERVDDWGLSADSTMRALRDALARSESPSPEALDVERARLLARWPEADLFAALDAEGWFRGMETGEASRATSKVYARLARSETF